MAFNQFPSKSGIPSGATAARPSNPAIGDTYYNGTTGQLEIYNGTTWLPCSAPAGSPTTTGATNVGTNRAFNDGAVDVAFTAPASGGTPTSYIAYVGTTFTVGTTSPIRVTSLAGGTTANAYVVGVNAFGQSPVANTIAEPQQLFQEHQHL